MRDERDDAPKQGGGYGHAITIGAIVLLAFAVRIWFNFVAEHPNNYGAADASEYLRNAQALFQVKLSMPFLKDCWSVLTNHATAATAEQVKNTFAPLKDFYISGPIYPLFLAAAYSIGAGHTDITNSTIPLVAQSIVSALTCGLIVATASLAYSRPTGYLAGLFAAFYPGFIVNSGRLYSETFAAFLLSAILYFTVRGLTVQLNVAKCADNAFLTGIAAAALQFTRSVMVIVSAALVPITFIQHGVKKGIVALIALLIGFAAVAAPWLAFQKLAFGSASLVVDRVGHYNFFIGNNIDTAGWLSFPYPDGRGIEEKPMQQLAKEAIGKNPRRWLQLMEDKPLRLLKFPWNDFRTAIGEASFKLQVLYHQIVLLLAVIGGTLGLVSSSRKRAPDFGYERPGRQPKDQMTARLFLLFVFAVHLTYLFFITVPRYNLTAMPILIIFAAAGVTALLRLFSARNGSVIATSIIFAAALLFAGADLDITSAFATAFGIKATVWGFVFKQGLIALSMIGLAASLCQGIGAAAPRSPFETRRHPSVKYATLVTLAVVLFALPIAIVPAQANGNWYEWRAPFDTEGQQITQRIRLTAADVKLLSQRQPYLLIDADGINSLNGVSIQVNGKPLTGPFIPNIALTEDFDRLQQARGVKMREGEWIFSCMTESMPMRNSDLRQWFVIPIDHSMLAANTIVTLRKTDDGPGTIYGAYTTGGKARHIPSTSVCSWEKAFYGVANADGLTDPRYETRVDGHTFVDQDSDMSVEKGLQTGSYNIRLLAGPAATPRAANLTIPTVVMPGATAAGHVEAQKSFGAVGITDKTSKAFSLTELPAYSQEELWFIRVSGNAKRNADKAALKFSITAPNEGVPYSSPWAPTLATTTNNRTFDFAVPFKPGAFKGLKKIDLSIASTGSTHGITELTDLKIEISKAPANPIAPGSIVL